MSNCQVKKCGSGNNTGRGLTFLGECDIVQPKITTTERITVGLMTSNLKDYSGFNDVISATFSTE